MPIDGRVKVSKWGCEACPFRIGRGDLRQAELGCGAVVDCRVHPTTDQGQRARINIGLDRDDAGAALGVADSIQAAEVLLGTVDRADAQEDPDQPEQLVLGGDGITQRNALQPGVGSLQPCRLRWVEGTTTQQAALQHGQIATPLEKRR